ncbi:hypothetical protein Q2T83_07515 [Fervidibacter sacchari]|uniref:hypothetical protein n=1 Tax=Candidatus Fervidibacter sacchari TaxID=1448929 RepID=UPI0026767B35|nr:hypothetical protein [Candidatus Fervidibacter sacchari]WKU17658.1 hypothetical protein Q2T83_07515 [Candidatus Fervidibacter sacchari]
MRCITGFARLFETDGHSGIDMLTSDPRTIVVGSFFIVPKLASSLRTLKGEPR